MAATNRNNFDNIFNLQPPQPAAVSPAAAAALFPSLPSHSDLKCHLEMAEALIKAASLVTDRYKRVSDPVLRHSLMLDKFLLLTEFMMGFLDSRVATFCQDVVQSGMIPRNDLLQSLRNLTSEVRNELDDLADWVANPKYIQVCKSAPPPQQQGQAQQQQQEPMNQPQQFACGGDHKRSSTLSRSSPPPPPREKERQQQHSRAVPLTQQNRRASFDELLGLNADVAASRD